MAPTAIARAGSPRVGALTSQSLGGSRLQALRRSIGPVEDDGPDLIRTLSRLAELASDSGFALFGRTRV